MSLTSQSNAADPHASVQRFLPALFKKDVSRTTKNRLNACRAAHHMTQEELAKKAGVSGQIIMAIEDDRYSPSLGLAFNLARTFNTIIEGVFLFEEDDRSQESSASTST